MVGIEILVKYLLEMGIDIDFGVETHAEGISSTVELIDMDTQTVIAYCRRDTMEEALFYIAAKCISDIRNVKVDYNISDVLNKTDLNEV